MALEPLSHNRSPTSGGRCPQSQKARDKLFGFQGILELGGHIQGAQGAALKMRTGVISPGRRVSKGEKEDLISGKPRMEGLPGSCRKSILDARQGETGRSRGMRKCSSTIAAFGGRK